ncbi:MAG: hypothetical protein QG657_1026 [Acidobacteriota bacterium]|nr:hypothetical protein [Acidobacteriota bacterium]
MRHDSRIKCHASRATRHVVDVVDVVDGWTGGQKAQNRLKYPHEPGKV